MQSQINTTLQKEFPALFSVSKGPNSTNPRTETTPGHLSSEETFKTGNWKSSLACLLDWGVKQSMSSADRIRWEGKTDGQYTVKAGYSSLCAQNEMLDTWPWNIFEELRR